MLRKLSLRLSPRSKKLKALAVARLLRSYSVVSLLVGAVVQTCPVVLAFSSSVTSESDL